MISEALIVMVMAARALVPVEIALPSGAPADDPAVSAVRYQPETRAVTNWRSEAAEALEPKPVAVLAALLNAERPLVTRCVKLNNYWCIKSARWNGELATDSEGHVGFVSAEHGADAAANLLRRYYLDFNRKSALDIVRRWAPPECNLATGLGGMAVLAVKGIGGTVRARYLASKRTGRSVRYTAPAKPGGKPGRVSLVLSLTPKTPAYRVPDIAAGLGERPKPPEPRVAATGSVKAEKPAPKAEKPVPKVETASACGSDEQRLRNYATRMAEGLDLKPTDDLKLFAADGTPLPNLAPVMLAMSAVELGALRAEPELVERAIQKLNEQAAGRQSEPSAARLP